MGRHTNAETRLAEVLGHRGAVAVMLLAELSDGELRFGELREQMNGMPQKTLVTNLRALENAGLVSRKVFAEIPPRVVYSLTKAGEGLAPTLRSLREWDKQYGRREREVI